MASDFMRQFLAGWQMGQDRIANQRQAQMMQMRQEQEAYQRQQDQIQNQLRMEEAKLRKQQADLEYKDLRIKMAREQAGLTPQFEKTTPPEMMDLGGATPDAPSAGMLNLGATVKENAPIMVEGYDGQMQRMPFMEEQQQMAQEGAIAEGKMLRLPDDPSVPEAFRGRVVPNNAATAALLQKWVEGPKTERPVSVAPGGTLINPSTGEVIFRAPDRPTASGSMTGEGGKPLLSGEINRLTEIDASLAEAQALKEKVTGIEGGTGTLAGLQAGLPNPVVQALASVGMTGAVDAKKRQAIVKLAKQIVGKGLEGGVLRKEDEAKYADILPSMYDDDEVATGKVDQLVAALQRKRQAELENLELAGRNVQGFKDKAPAQKATTSGGKYKIIEVR